MLELVRFVHVISFVFMSIPLFNLIVVNERAALNLPFNYHVDRYMENIIRKGATRCFSFQATVFISGLLLLAFGSLGFDALWTNWVVVAKAGLLVVLMVLLSYVHFRLQPRIDSLLVNLTADSAVPQELVSSVKPLRVRRKNLATLCLFLVITEIILGLQVYSTISPLLTVTLIVLAGLFALRVNKTLIRFGWI
jgi:uncharacterized membrane protein